MKKHKTTQPNLVSLNYLLLESLQYAHGRYILHGLLEQTNLLRIRRLFTIGHLAANLRTPFQSLVIPTKTTLNHI